MSDLLESSKALLRLDADNALVPHGLGGHGRGCLQWCVDEIDRLRKVEGFVREYADAKLNLHGADARDALMTMQKRARKALLGK